jgi:hypothetical protein
MYPWIWIQSVLRELWLIGYTLLIPLRWKLDPAWQRGSLRHNSGYVRPRNANAQLC